MFSILRRFQVQAGPLGSGSCMRTRTSPLTLVHVCCVQALSFDNESASHPAAPAAARPARARLRCKCAGRTLPAAWCRGRATAGLSGYRSLSLSLLQAAQAHMSPCTLLRVCSACHQYFTPGQDWLFNTKQRNGGKELEEAGVNVDGWGGSVMNK